MGQISDIKAKFVEALTSLSVFDGDKAKDVYPYRALEPEVADEQSASKMSGLAAFVSVERIKKGNEDRAAAKRAIITIDLWVNVWKPIGDGGLSDRDGAQLVQRDGSPIGARITEAEKLLEDVIEATDGLVVSEHIGCPHNKAAFQDAYRIEKAPKPFLVYRITINSNIIISKD